ncbi:MAG: hypothetical protein QXW80_06385 [Candidatus Micrarchaeia archaeon]
MDVPKKDLFHVPIVGTGEKTTLQCGEVQYSYACEQNHRIPVKYNCSHPDCPECYHNWVSQTTGRIVPRLLALYRPFESKQSKINDIPVNNDLTLNKMRKLSKYPYRHIVISFPPDFVGENPFAEVQKRIKQLQLYGVAIYHPYRLTHEAKEKIKNLRNMELYSGGSWEIWHKSGLYLQSNTIYYSPHVHIITSGYIPANLENDLHQEGFVLKIIRVVGKPDLSSEQSLASLVHYLLTHCGYAGKSKSYRYLGMSGRVSLVKNEVTIEQPLECPICGHQMYKSVQLTNGDWFTDFSMPIFISVKILEYTIQISSVKKLRRKRG